jgi:hypothetical protein
MYVYLVEGGHRASFGHGGGRGQVRLISGIGSRSGIRPPGDARVSRGMVVGEVIIIASMKAPEASC